MQWSILPYNQESHKEEETAPHLNLLRQPSKLNTDYAQVTSNRGRDERGEKWMLFSHVLTDSYYLIWVIITAYGVSFSHYMVKSYHQKLHYIDIQQV